jgi:dTMP kinase
MYERGKFIVFEGVGGAGKSEQSALAVKYLQNCGKEVISTREPGGSPSAERIRELIFELKTNNLLTPDQQIAMFFTARDFWLREVVLPKLDSGMSIISDRTYTSTGAYQAHGEGGDLNTIERWVDCVVGRHKPDSIILIDVDASVAYGRVNPDGDPFDKLGLPFQERVVNGYRQMAKTNWSGVPWHVVNGEQTIEEVHNSIKIVLNGIFNL